MDQDPDTARTAAAALAAHAVEDAGEDVAKSVEVTLLGGERKYTRIEVAKMAGVPLDRIHRLWRAMGFAAAGDDDVLFTDADVTAARIGYDFVESGLIDSRLDAALTRTLGHFLSRLAEMQVQVVWDWISKQPGLSPDEPEIATVVEAMLPTMQQLQDYIWRRHLAAFADRALAAQAEAMDDPGAERVPRQVVGFVDMVGYTRLTRQTDEHQLLDILERFEALAADVVYEHHGRIVKMIGDEVLFVADSPADAVEIAFSLGERAAEDVAIPELRTGLAYGRVVNRLGDVFGEVVNVAARLTSVARPDTVLVDSNLATVLRVAGGYEVRSIPATSVRGYSRLRPYVVRRLRRRSR
ncbi:adenylate/guanylate cyclase domain-containing protein [Streptomyces sp. DSM 44917]|uniref:Adenylate/guanylate cyclase domain-containing protein n=1 Tax=Streptomyces boetiae TaxID=3075541 RepID=A0ABU2LDL4_9ACTN|nr:adenylate/guanylate cyclase domain-containing protein [Streptomyces sp. DSM 44917]MDT0309358.1 adenylate/guanylate cyclase domain-containing protein [Streptomyces sp. DSM 44917]